MKNLGQQLLDIIEEATLNKTAEIGLKHAEENRPYIEKTILDLAPQDPREDSGSALVFSAGPSLHRRNPAVTVLDSGYKGDIIAVDGALGYCLRHGLIPSYVVTVDPHPYRIVRWFGDPELAHREPDDYFGRQDLEPAFHQDELAYNEELHGGSVLAPAGAFRQSYAPTGRTPRRDEFVGAPCRWSTNVRPIPLLSGG